MFILTEADTPQHNNFYRNTDDFLRAAEVAYIATVKEQASKE